ncbi:MAG TPA: hypothetical protein PKC18_12770 [Lacipirellulaceae bacterium]|nr:hypothetical protein [Lacipirellulaceae bacterium]
MFASTHLPSHALPWGSAVRWLARIASVVLVLAWVATAILEALHPDFYLPMALKWQGVALAVTFAGYVIAWHWETVGGVLAILGVLAFFAVNALTVGALPLPAAAWFAAPGVLFILAHRIQPLAPPVPANSGEDI